MSLRAVASTAGSSGFPITLGSTEVDASSTTSTLAGLTLTAPLFTGLIKTATTYTVATLPSAAASSGARAFVTDGAAVPVFGAIAAGSGSLFLPVFCDGTNWRNG